MTEPKPKKYEGYPNATHGVSIQHTEGRNLLAMNPTSDGLVLFRVISLPHDQEPGHGVVEMTKEKAISGLMQMVWLLSRVPNPPEKE